MKGISTCFKLEPWDSMPFLKCVCVMIHMYLSIFNLCSLFAWRHNTQNEVTDFMNVLVLTLSSVSHRTKNCWATRQSGSPVLPWATALVLPYLCFKTRELTINCSFQHHGPKHATFGFSFVVPLPPVHLLWKHVWLIRENRAAMKERYETTSLKVRKN